MKVIIATPSLVDRSRLVRTLSGRPDITLVGQPADLSQTYTLCEAEEPDVVLLARAFVDCDEFSCMRSVFYAVRSHWIVIADPNRPADQTPGQKVHEPVVEVGMTADQLVGAMRAVTQVAIRRPADRTPVAPAVLSHSVTDRVVLIGASTGGVDALLTVLAGFPLTAPPIAVVQHTGHGFSDSLIRLLDRRASVEVRAAQDGMMLEPGTVCIAAGTARHLRLAGRPGRQLRATLTVGEPVSGHLPSVDALFSSAIPFAQSVIAVLLTGMGRDGAAGMLALRQAGATTIAQDEATSVVYGMPRAAWETGAAGQRLPLDRIAPEILRLSARDVARGSAVR